MSEACEGLKLDLHNHSNRSDGAHTPAEVVRKAEAAGIRVFGLSDHDNVSGIDEGYEESLKTSVKLVAGVEISTPKKIHIQGLCPDIRNECLTSLLKQQDEKRKEHTRELCRKMNAAGIMADYDDLMNSFPGTVNKYSVSQYLLKKKLVNLSSPDDVYRKYFGIGGEIQIGEAGWCKMEEAVECILKAGGIPVLAHIWRYFDPKKPENTRERRLEKMHDLAERFKKAGGEAMETLGCRQGETEDFRYELTYPTELALEFDLYASCGTDYHMDSKSPLGAEYVFDKRLKPVWMHPKFHFYRPEN